MSLASYETEGSELYARTGEGGQGEDLLQSLITAQLSGCFGSQYLILRSIPPVIKHSLLSLARATMPKTDLC